MSTATTSDVTASRLRLEVETTQVDKATQSLDAMVSSGKAAEGSALALKTAFLGTVAAVTAVGAAVAAFSYKMYDGSKASSQIRSELTSVVGDAGKAQKAFSDLVVIASSIDGGITEAAKAFEYLVAHGLTPTEEAMLAYQDHAARYGASLEEYVHAVGNAADGQLEGLRKFGVDLKLQNGQLIASFQGQKTTIEATTHSLENYLIKLSQTRFKGASDARHQNVSALMKDIQTEFNMFFINLASQSGVDNVLVQFFSYALDEAKQFNNYIASGQMAQEFHMLGEAISPLAGIARSAFQGITNAWITESAVRRMFANQESSQMHSIWLDMPTGVKTAVDRIVEYWSDLLLRVKYIAVGIKDTFILEFTTIAQKAQALGEDIKRSFSNPFEAFDKSTFDAAIKSIDENHDKEAKSIQDTFDLKVSLLDKYNRDATEKITQERNTSIQAIEDQYQKAEQLREEYEKKQASGKNLSGFGSPDRKIEKRGNGGGGKNTELQSLEDSLGNQEEQIKESYDKRLAIIDKYTVDGSALELDLTNKLVDQTGSELSRISEMRTGDLESFYESLRNAETLLKQSYEHRRETILNNTSITEEQRQKMLSSAALKYQEQDRILNQKRNAATLADAQTFFGNLASIGSAFGAKGFKIAKAAAIANATISMYDSAVGAYDSVVRIPYVGPYLAPVAAGAAIAAGAANIAKIQSQSYSGAYDLGGQIPSGSYGLVGERGPELVMGPAMVTGRTTTSGNGTFGGKAPVVNVTINNLPGQTAQVAQSTDPSGNTDIRIIIAQVEQKLAGDVKTGSGTLIPAMSRQFGLTRRPV